MIINLCTFFSVLQSRALTYTPKVLWVSFWNSFVKKKCLLHQMMTCEVSFFQDFFLSDDPHFYFCFEFHPQKKSIRVFFCKCPKKKHLFVAVFLKNINVVCICETSVGKVFKNKFFSLKFLKKWNVLVCTKRQTTFLDKLDEWKSF